MQMSLIEYSNKIIDHLNSIHKNLKELITDNSKKKDFTVPQILLMHELYHYPNITLNELSDRLNLSKSTVSGIIKRLVQQDIVTRTIPEENRRIVNLSLSPEVQKKGEIFLQIKTSHMKAKLEKEKTSDINKLLNALIYLDNLLKPKE